MRLGKNTIGGAPRSSGLATRLEARTYSPTDLQHIVKEMSQAKLRSVFDSICPV